MKRIITVVLVVSVVLCLGSCGRKGETVKVTESPTQQNADVKLAVTDEEMGAYVDTAENSYKSFEIIPVDKPDFFVGKELRLAAVLNDHNLSNLYALNARAEFTGTELVMNVPDENGEVKTSRFFVYTSADEVKKSPSGKAFSYVAYGTEEITSEKTDGAIGIVCMIKMREDVDMGEALADSYVLLMETSTPDAYQIYKIEE